MQQQKQIEDISKWFVYNWFNFLQVYISLTIHVSKMAKRGVYAVLFGCPFINGLFTVDQPSIVSNSIFGAIILVF